ncbi:MAG: rhodanese-like domain-containing protein [Myxococcota bacterium]
MRQIDIEQLKQALDNGDVSVLIDVREADEYAAGHVPGTQLIALSELQERAGELDAHKGTAIHLICKSGGRSARAAMFLDSMGHDTVNVAGGTMGWINAGHEVER